MAAQMLVISPVLSTISALVVPLVALVIALLGLRLQRISRKAHLSIAALSTYLNEFTGMNYHQNNAITKAAYEENNEVYLIVDG
ncbi:hypothetical protein BVRB_2g036840 isoform B [Beta vulgaris subsp. vulgaris]|uniref:ABC transmembrane type-1 domain-containing protein n=1 Tax=Beta vulgaris subsp. vulgaris TaxID=3555 RepID=A0A0J8FP51_BETVV|nr:hypothetical protein BVRB_2g036840 isoform B [Beta vulgaris subsp. vulgaris]